MTGQPSVSQRDLRTRSKEIMDDVERGQTFTVTREGHGIAELIPLRRHRVFVTRAEFAASSAQAPDVDLDAFQADLDTAYDHDLHDPYGH